MATIGRRYPVWFALCGWQPWYAPHGQELANSARIGPDTGTGWTAVMKNVENALPVQNFTGGKQSGGYWNDGSLMLTPGMGCPGFHGGANTANCMTDDRFTSMFSLWTILSFNILLVGDFDRLNAFVLSTYSNAAAIAINQDPLGIAAVRVDGGTESPGALLYTEEEATLAQNQLQLLEKYQAMKVQECGGEPEDQKWVLNYMDGRIHNPHRNVCLNVESCETRLIYDSCPAAGKGCKATPTMPFPNEVFQLKTNGQLVSALPGHLCATVGSSNTVTLETCTEPVAARQKWIYDNATQQLTTGAGMCVTATTAPSPTPIKATNLILGRPLSDRGFAVLFLNNKNASMQMTCDEKCMIKMGVPATGQKYTVQDVVTHEVVMSVSAGQPLKTKMAVGGNGASIYYRLTPV
jgi:hypothetical protein